MGRPAVKDIPSRQETTTAQTENGQYPRWQRSSDIDRNSAAARDQDRSRRHLPRGVGGRAWLTTSLTGLPRQTRKWRWAMFKKHASLRIAGLRRLGPRPGMPRGTVAAHANDNLPGLRRPAGQRRSPPPGLACHWVLADGNRLECRWQIDPGEIGIEEPGGRRGTRSLSGSPSAFGFNRPLSSAGSRRQ
jgi:hypothetical protein